MILLLNTSTGLCQLTLVDGNDKYEYEWQADRSLARDLLSYLRDRLSDHGKTFADISGIGVMQGPGSFTGLRIGLTIMNTLASDLGCPIVGGQGEDWQGMALNRLENGEDDKLVMPYYGREANITKPRK